MLTLAEAHIALDHVRLMRMASGKCATVDRADAYLSVCGHGVRVVVFFSDEDYASFVYSSPKVIEDFNEEQWVSALLAPPSLAKVH